MFAGIVSLADQFDSVTPVDLSGSNVVDIVLGDQPQGGGVATFDFDAPLAPGWYAVVSWCGAERSNRPKRNGSKAGRTAGCLTGPSPITVRQSPPATIGQGGEGIHAYITNSPPEDTVVPSAQSPIRLFHRPVSRLLGNGFLAWCSSRSSTGGGHARHRDWCDRHSRRVCVPKWAFFGAIVELAGPTDFSSPPKTVPMWWR